MRAFAEFPELSANKRPAPEKHKFNSVWGFITCVLHNGLKAHGGDLSVGMGEMHVQSHSAIGLKGMLQMDSCPALADVVQPSLPQRPFFPSSGGQYGHRADDLVS